MKDGWLTKRDISDLFEGAPADSGENIPDSQPDGSIRSSIPLFDPLAILERLSGGRFKDPILHRLRQIARGDQS